MKSVVILCVLPLLCWAGEPKKHPVVPEHEVKPAPVIKPEPKQLQVQLSGHDVTVCTHGRSSNLAVILLFTDKAKARDTFCPNEHVVTVISSTSKVEEAKQILQAVVGEVYQYGGSAKRLTLMGEGHSAFVVWGLIQEPSVHDLYRNVVFYDVIPGLYDVTMKLESLPSGKKVIFGLAPHKVLEQQQIHNDDVIHHAANYLAKGDERLLKTLQFFYGKRPMGTVIQDITLFRGVKKGLEKMMETGDVFFYEGADHQDKLTEAVLIFALTGTPGFITTQTEWPRFEAETRMYLDLSGSEATFEEGWRRKNSMLWKMINQNY